MAITAIILVIVLGILSIPETPRWVLAPALFMTLGLVAAVQIILWWKYNKELFMHSERNTDKPSPHPQETH